MGCEAIALVTGTARCEHLALDPTPRSPRLARRFVVEHAPGGLAPDALDALLLLTSELVTNAVLHARTKLELGLADCGDRVVVSVTDRHPDRPRSRPQDGAGESGRGMLLVEALAGASGVEYVEQGKVVWFALDVHRDADHGAGTPA